MNLFTGANIRRLIPAGAVAAVLALSYLSPLPSFASNGGFGYNCGVKGYGYHDHGKPCTNRPFPGHGVGLAKFGITAITGENKTSVGHRKNASVISAATSSTDSDSAQSAPTTIATYGRAGDLGKCSAGSTPSSFRSYSNIS